MKDIVLIKDLEIKGIAFKIKICFLGGKSNYTTFIYCGNEQDPYQLSSHRYTTNDSLKEYIKYVYERVNGLAEEKSGWKEVLKIFDEEDFKLVTKKVEKR
jgi:hypothetical protein